MVQAITCSLVTLLQGAFGKVTEASIKAMSLLIGTDSILLCADPANDQGTYRQHQVRLPSAGFCTFLMLSYSAQACSLGCADFELISPGSKIESGDGIGSAHVAGSNVGP